MPAVMAIGDKLHIILFSQEYTKTRHFKWKKHNFFWGGARPVEDPSLGGKVALPHSTPPPHQNLRNPHHPLEFQADLCHCVSHTMDFLLESKYCHRVVSQTAKKVLGDTKIFAECEIRMQMPIIKSARRI